MEEKKEKETAEGVDAPARLLEAPAWNIWLYLSAQIISHGTLSDCHKLYAAFLLLSLLNAFGVDIVLFCLVYTWGNTEEMDYN